MDVKLIVRILGRLFRATLWFMVAALGFGLYRHTVFPAEGWLSSVCHCSPFVFPVIAGAIGELTGRLNTWFFAGFAIPFFGVLLAMVVVVVFNVIAMVLFITREVGELIEIFLN